jgi:hypothetical protein
MAIGQHVVSLASLISCAYVTDVHDLKQVEKEILIASCVVAFSAWNDHLLTQTGSEISVTLTEIDVSAFYFS